MHSESVSINLSVRVVDWRIKAISFTGSGTY